MIRAELVKGHPGDERLIEAYLDGSGAAADQTREHIETCATCRERFLQLTGDIEAQRASAVAEADAVFTELRLERQRSRILARLSALSRSARVIPFPVMRARTFGPSQAIVMKRWVAAAAAAGLLLGLGLGRLSLVPRQPAPAAVRQIVQPHIEAAGGRAAGADATTVMASYGDDEQLLLEIEDSVAREHSRIRELQVIDQLTPRVQTAVARLR